MTLISKIKVGNKHFWIQHVKVVPKRLVTNFYVEMPSTCHFSGNLVKIMTENMILTSYLDKSHLVTIFCRHSNDVARQVEITSKSKLLSRNKCNFLT